MLVSRKSKKTQLTIEQRVDTLLEVGIDEHKKWMAVDRYREPDEYAKHERDGCFNEACFDDLRDHHLEETGFLFDVIKELVKRCKDRT